MKKIILICLFIASFSFKGFAFFNSNCRITKIVNSSCIGEQDSFYGSYYSLNPVQSFEAILYKNGNLINTVSIMNFVNPGMYTSNNFALNTGIFGALNDSYDIILKLVDNVGNTYFSSSLVNNIFEGFKLGLNNDLTVGNFNKVNCNFIKISNISRNNCIGENDSIFVNYLLKDTTVLKIDAELFLNGISKGTFNLQNYFSINSKNGSFSFSSSIFGSLNNNYDIVLKLTDKIGKVYHSSIALNGIFEGYSAGLNNDLTVGDYNKILCLDSGKIRIDSFDYCYLNASYELPTNKGVVVGSLNSVYVLPFKNGNIISGYPPILLNSKYINSSTRKILIPKKIIENNWSGLINFDIVLMSNYTATFGIIVNYSKLSNPQGFINGYNNDIFPTYSKISYIVDSQMFYSNNCKLTIKTTYPNINNTFQACKINLCNLTTLIGQFNFNKGFYNYPMKLDGYDFYSVDSLYDCNTDKKSYEIKYICSYIDCDTFFAKVFIESDCNIVLCQNLVCGTDANTILNPFLNNLCGNIRPQQTLIYNTKREPLSQSNKRAGEYFSEFTPLVSYQAQASSWLKSNDPNWIVKDFITNYNHKGNQIETKNPLNIYSATKYGFNHSLPIAIAQNSKYKEFMFLGFDDNDYFENNCDKTTLIQSEKYTLPIISASTNYNVATLDQTENISFADVVNTTSHTGEYSYFVIPKCFYRKINNQTFPNNEFVKLCETKFMSKVFPLCGPEDPNYNGNTYDINSSKNAVSITNSYNATFNLEKGKDYVLSYWVKNTNSTGNAIGISNEFELGYIDVYFDCDTTFVKKVVVPSATVEGWNQININFKIPLNSKIMKMVFFPYKDGTYYDDIRIFPFDGNMKSYVYEPRMMKLNAELDENNFATFYDYDEQGQLIRVRKETERGIMTIKETRTYLKN